MIFILNCSYRYEEPDSNLAMKLSSNQGFNQFMTAATLTTWGSSRIQFASARVGKGLREAPVRRGYDATAPFENRGSDFFYNWPGSQSIERSLEILLEHEQEQEAEEEEDDLTKIQNTNSTPRITTATILRNMDINNATSLITTKRSRPMNATNDHDHDHDHDHDLVDKLDLGILHATPSSVPSLHNVEKSMPKESICMMGHDKDELLPADAYLRHEIAIGRFAYSQILFDEASNTIFCNQENDIDDDIGTAHHTYGCASMHFKGCATVKCNGKESCINTVIEDAVTIECEGYESCRDAKLDATTVDCGGEAACMSATIGSKGFVTTLDCHSGESACAYAKVSSVGSVFCTGPLSCYGAEILGVTQSVTCQGVPHQHQYYMPTCGGGKSGAIEAEDGSNIDVVCDGDFACIGNGQNDKDLPSYFGIDVGENGMLTCGGSLIGNKDGFTFVCKYIDLGEGCSSYECKEPSFALADHAIAGMFDTRDLKTCSKVFSLDQDEMCTGEAYDHSDDDDNDDDDDDDDDDEDDSDDKEEGEEEDSNNKRRSR